MARKRRAAALAAVSNWEAAVMDAIPSGGEGGGKRGASDFDLEKEENATKGQQRRRKERHRESERLHRARLAAIIEQLQSNLPPDLLLRQTRKHWEDRGLGISPGTHLEPTAAPTGGVGGITKAVILETVLERMVHLEKQYIEYKALKEKIASLRARKHSLKVSDIFTLDENSPAGLLDQPLVIPPLPNSNSGNAGLDENVQMHQSPGQSTIEATMSPIPSAADFNRQTMNFAMHLHEPKQEQYGSQENLGQEGTILQQIKTIATGMKHASASFPALPSTSMTYSTASGVHTNADGTVADLPSSTKHAFVNPFLEAMAPSLATLSSKQESGVKRCEAPNHVDSFCTQCNAFQCSGSHRHAGVPSSAATAIPTSISGGVSGISNSEPSTSNANPLHSTYAGSIGPNKTLGSMDSVPVPFEEKKPRRPGRPRKYPRQEKPNPNNPGNPNPTTSTPVILPEQVSIVVPAKLQAAMGPQRDSMTSLRARESSLSNTPLPQIQPLSLDRTNSYSSDLSEKSAAFANEKIAEQLRKRSGGDCAFLPSLLGTPSSTAMCHLQKHATNPLLASPATPTGRFSKLFTPSSSSTFLAQSTSSGSNGTLGLPTGLPSPLSLREVEHFNSLRSASSLPLSHSQKPTELASNAHTLISGSDPAKPLSATDNLSKAMKPGTLGQMNGLSNLPFPLLFSPTHMFSPLHQHSMLFSNFPSSQQASSRPEGALLSQANLPTPLGSEANKEFNSSVYNFGQSDLFSDYTTNPPGSLGIENPQNHLSLQFPGLNDTESPTCRRQPFDNLFNEPEPFLTKQEAEIPSWRANSPGSTEAGLYRSGRDSPGQQLRGRKESPVLDEQGQLQQQMLEKEHKEILEGGGKICLRSKSVQQTEPLFPEQKPSTLLPSEHKGQVPMAGEPAIEFEAAKAEGYDDDGTDSNSLEEAEQEEYDHDSSNGGGESESTNISGDFDDIDMDKNWDSMGENVRPNGMSTKKLAFFDEASPQASTPSIDDFPSV